jgi:hypothetical protein
MRVFNDFNDLKGAVGTEVGVNGWMEITQDRILCRGGNRSTSSLNGSTPRACDPSDILRQSEKASGEWG